MAETLKAFVDAGYEYHDSTNKFLRFFKWPYLGIPRPGCPCPVDTLWGFRKAASRFKDTLLRLGKKWAWMMCREEGDDHVSDEAEEDTTIHTEGRPGLERSLLAQMDVIREDIYKRAEWSDPMHCRNLDSFDAIVTDLSNAFEFGEGPLPWWLVIAFATLTEVYDMFDFGQAVTQANLAHGVDDMTSSISRFRELQSNQTLWRMLRSPSVSRDIDNFLHGYQYASNVQWIGEGSRTFEIREARLSTNPFVYLNYLRHRMANTALDTITQSTVVIAIMGLYRAAQRMQMTSFEWHDMESFLCHHSLEQPGGESVLRQRDATVLVDEEDGETNEEEEYLRTKRRVSHDESLHLPSEDCSDSERSTFCFLLGGHMSTEDGESDALPSDAQISTRALEFKLTPRFTTMPNAMVVFSDSAFVSYIDVALRRQHDDDSQGLWPRSGPSKRSPVEELVFVEDILRQEELSLNFDRLGFLDRCARYLTMLMARSKHVIPEADFAMFEHEYQWVDYLLADAAQDRAAEALKETAFYRVVLDLESLYRFDGSEFCRCGQGVVQLRSKERPKSRNRFKLRS